MQIMLIHFTLTLMIISRKDRILITMHYNLSGLKLEVIKCSDSKHIAVKKKNTVICWYEV